MIHGWNADSNHISIQSVRNAYLKRNVSHVMSVDWSEIASLPYIVARDLIAIVGGKICVKLKTFMESWNVSAASIHIVGHSLGCHIATHVGRCFNGEIGRYEIGKFDFFKLKNFLTAIFKHVEFELKNSFESVCLKNKHDCVFSIY